MDVLAQEGRQGIFPSDFFLLFGPPKGGMMPANVMKGDPFTHPTESDADLLQKQPRRQVTVTGKKNRITHRDMWET